MIKLARSDKDKRRVFDYLQSKGTTPATNEFYFKEVDGKIVGAFGVEMKLCIEPMQCEDKVTFFEMAHEAKGIAMGVGAEKLHIFSDNQAVIKNIQERFGATNWGNNLTELMLIL